MSSLILIIISFEKKMIFFYVFYHFELTILKLYTIL